jgi:N6-adenosine-specific RNA methylase IME4
LTSGRRAQVRAARGPGGRPRGDVRNVLFGALEAGPPMTLREVADRCQVGYKAARWTLKRLVCAAEIHIVGHVKRAHCRRPIALYGIAEPLPRQASAVSALGAALARWGR